LETHLRACPNCSNYLAQIRITIRLSGAIEPEDLSPEAVEDLTQLYRRWRNDFKHDGGKPTGYEPGQDGRQEPPPPPQQEGR
jgi:hypothetical protein